MITPDDPNDLDENGCFKGRTMMHRWMMPAGSCARCDGRGWHPTADENGDEGPEVYCGECPGGKLREKLETANRASKSEIDALLGDLPRFTKEGRCTQPKITAELTFRGFIDALTGPMPELCGEPATDVDGLGRRVCPKHGEEIRKNTREGKNVMGILMGRHRSH